MANAFFQEIDESCAPSRVRDIASVAVIDAKSTGLSIARVPNSRMTMKPVAPIARPAMEYDSRW